MLWVRWVGDERKEVFHKGLNLAVAEPIGETLPSFIEGADVQRMEDGTWFMRTPWGERTGLKGEGYWISFGRNDAGLPIADIIAKSTDEYKEYIVIDDFGKCVGWLYEIDP